MRFDGKHDNKGHRNKSPTIHPVREVKRKRGRPLVVGHSHDSMASMKFVVVLDETSVRWPTLPIPIEFGKRLECKKARTVKVRLGARCNWKMRLLMFGSRIHLTNGWQEFANAAKLKAGYVLHFHVPSATDWALTIFNEKFVECPMICKHHESG